MKVRELLKLLEKDGWSKIAQEGSHHKHPVKPGRVTIAGHPGDDVPPGTLNSVLHQAGLKKKGRR